MPSSAPTTLPSDPPVDRRAGEAGFSLAEMLVVLAILGLCLALAAPNLRSTSGEQSAHASARAIAGLLRAARAEAIFSGGQARVTIDLAGKKVRAGWSNDHVALPSETSVTVLTVREEVVAGDQASFAFFPDGSATGGSIRLKAEAGEESIFIDWLTGKIEHRANAN
jgi:general secretion pathway protein H